ncbi:hypothetical protein GCM10028775_62520 [Catellatospora paridis]
MNDGEARIPGISRKTLLRTALVVPAVPLLLAGVPALASTPSGQPLTVTPESCDDDELTPPQMEGPCFKPGSPLRTTMVDGAGTRLTLTGYVAGLACQPIAGALLDARRWRHLAALPAVYRRCAGHLQWPDLRLPDRPHLAARLGTAEHPRPLAPPLTGPAVSGEPHERTTRLLQFPRNSRPPPGPVGEGRGGSWPRLRS